jgi:hypothetical protein
LERVSTPYPLLRETKTGSREPDAAEGRVSGSRATTRGDGDGLGEPTEGITNLRSRRRGEGEVQSGVVVITW